MKQIFRILSCDGVHTLSGVVYLPDGEARGYFHIVHGMTEHIARYDRIMQDMADAGYITFGYDHLGHGYTVRDKSELGFVAKRGGDRLLVEDVKIFSDAVMAAYEPTYGKLPYYLMGHSMGSFITRLAVETCVKPEKYIIMGTGGKNPAAGAGLAIVGLIKCLRGARHISPLLYRLAFGGYNKRFGGGTREDPSPWLTRDEAERRKYYADPLCTFKFTASAMGDLIRLMKRANRGTWYKHVARDMPILLLSGDMDPVGNYGRGVTQVYRDLKKAGCRVQCILYPDARHEVLNDTTYETVRADIQAFLSKEAES